MLGIAAALLWGEDAFRKGLGSEPPGKQFPNVVLTTQHGKKVRLYDDLLQGRTVAVNTFFAGCTDVCPLGTAKMMELHRLFGDRVGKDIFFYSISIDPLHDTPQSLKAYADRYNVGPGWLFLTGSEADVALVTKKLGLGALQATQPRDNHSTTLMVGSAATGQWMKHSVTDNPRFVAASVETFLGWSNTMGTHDYAEAAPIANLTNGAFLFNNGCAACHTIGGGDKIGPDLLAIAERRDRQWLERFILVPDEVLDAKDPLAMQLLQRYGGVRMPNLGLARDEVAEILAHIESRTIAVRAEARSKLAAR